MDTTLLYNTAANLSNNHLSSTSPSPLDDKVSEIKPYPDRPETYIVPVLFFIIFVVGVFGNGALVLIFVRHRVIRNVPNIYILSLALGDLLVIISCVPFTSTIYTVDTWPFGELICKISETSKDISIGVSVFTLTALSADRFFAIVDPLKKLHSSIGGRRATKFTICVTLSIWIFSSICAAPAAIFSFLKPIPDENFTMFVVCYPYPNESYARTAVTMKFFIYYAIPLIIIAFFYILMARHLIRSTRNLPGEAQGQLRQIKARRKVAKTVLAFVIIFAICFFPQHLFMLWFYYNPNSQDDYNPFWHIFRMVGFCLSFLNSCVNPIALYFVSGTFRKYFDDYLYVCCNQRIQHKYGSRVARRNKYVSSTEPRGSTRIVGSSNSTGVTEISKQRNFWKLSASSKPSMQMNLLKKTDTTLTTEFTVTTLLNGIDSKELI